MRVSLIVFEINEIDGMRAMMPQIRPEWYDELIIVDGGSTDGTIEYARGKGYNLFVQEQRGVGAALNEAVAKATGDVVVLYAPDGSFPVDRIPLMLAKIREGYDVVNVSRYCQGARSYDDNFFTGMGNMTFSFLAKLFFGWHITDWLFTYLAFKREIVRKLKINTTSMAWGQILLLRSWKAKLMIAEIPGDEPMRVGGEVKVPKLRAAWALFETLRNERFSRLPR